MKKIKARRKKLDRLRAELHWSKQAQLMQSAALEVQRHENIRLHDRLDEMRTERNELKQIVMNAINGAAKSELGPKFLATGRAWAIQVIIDEFSWTQMHPELREYSLMSKAKEHLAELNAKFPYRS